MDKEDKKNLISRMRWSLREYMKATRMKDPPFDVEECAEYMAKQVEEEAVRLFRSVLQSLR